jgi:hypothetical protein
MFAGALLATPAAAQFTPFTDRTRADIVLEGNWQSCRENDGQFGERIYDGRGPGLRPFEFHLGPYHDFALFAGIQDEHRSHDATANLLRPYQIDLVAGRAHQRWRVLGLEIEVMLAGGSREECESWWVLVRRRPESTS